MGFLDLSRVSRAENSVSEGTDVAKDGWKGSKTETEECTREDGLCSEDLLGLPHPESSVSELMESANDDLPANRSIMSCDDIREEAVS